MHYLIFDLFIVGAAVRKIMPFVRVREMEKRKMSALKAFLFLLALFGVATTGYVIYDVALSSDKVARQAIGETAASTALRDQSRARDFLSSELATASAG